MRAADGGAALGPRTRFLGRCACPPTRRPSKRWSSLHSTISAASGRAVGPVQAVAALGVVERVIAAGAEGYRVGGQPVGAVRARHRRDQSGDEQATQCGQQQRAASRRGPQTLPPRHPVRRLCVLALVRVGEQLLAFGCLQHPLYCDRRVRRCDKRCSCNVMRLCLSGGRCCRGRRAKVGFAAVIDLKLLREKPGTRCAPSQRARGEDSGLVDALLEADIARRAAVVCR